MKLPLLTALAMTASLASAIAKDNPADARHAAETVMAKFDAAYNRHDSAAIAAMFVPEATFVPASRHRPLAL